MALIYAILIVILCLINVLSIYNITSSLEVFRQPIQIILIGATLIQLMVNGRLIKKLRPTPILISLLFALYLLFQIFFNSNNIFNDVSNSLFGIVVFILFYTANWDSISIERMKKYSFPILLVFSILYIIRRIDITFTSTEAWSLYINSIYYPVCLLPFVLLNRKYALFSIICVLLCSVASAKQGAFIATIMSGVIYYFVNQRIAGKKVAVKLLLMICFMAVACMYSYDYMVNNYNIDIMDGLSTISEDGGNGRMDIYKSVIANLYNADIFQLLLGHGGLNSVANDIGISAHNDFLEVFYDFGLVGFSLYLSMILMIIKYSIETYRQRSSITAGIFASLTIFLILSMVSHIMFILKYGLLIFSFWGLSLNLQSRHYYEK